MMCLVASDPRFIGDRVTNFDLNPGTRCVFLVCILYCLWRWPLILLTTDSGKSLLVLLSRFQFPRQASDPGHWIVSP